MDKFRTSNHAVTSDLFVKYYGVYQHPITREKFLITEYLPKKLENFNKDLDMRCESLSNEPKDRRLQELVNAQLRLERYTQQ